MKLAAALFLSCALSSIQAQEIFVPRQLKASAARTLPQELHDNGLLPYHKLTVEDFQVNDEMYPSEMMTCVFLVPVFTPDYKPKENGFVAFVKTWEVVSGIDRNLSARKSWFKDLRGGLIHEQGHMDLAALYARQLTAISSAALPTGEGETRDSASQALFDKIEAYMDRETNRMLAEQQKYDRETAGGTNREKQRKATALITERLRKAGITYKSAKR